MAEARQLVVRDPTQTLPSVEVLKNMKAVATEIVKSGLAPKAINTPEKALAVMVKGFELGIGVMQSMSDIYVVHGQASMTTKLMMALYRDAGHRFEVLQKDPNICQVRLFLRDGQVHDHEMTREEATEARFDQQWDSQRGQWKLKQTWEQMPTLLLFYRTMSSGIRLYAPEVLFRTMTRDEAESLTPEELDAMRVNGAEVIEGKYTIKEGEETHGPYDEPTRQKRIEDLAAELARLHRLQEEEALAQAVAETPAQDESDENGTEPLVTGTHWSDDAEQRQTVLQAMNEYELNDRDARRALSQDCGQEVVRLTDYTKDKKACLTALRLFAKQREQEATKSEGAEQGKLV